MTIVISGNKIPKDGYYQYDGHILHECGAFVSSIVKNGLYLAKGYTAPDLGTCNCTIRWRLVN